LQHADYALEIVGPPVLLLVAKIAEAGAFPVGEINRVEAQMLILSSGYRNLNVVIDRHRKDETLIVVGVFADQINPTWCLCNYVWTLAILFLMAANQIVHE
jgi:hypothetical protein